LGCAGSQNFIQGICRAASPRWAALAARMLKGKHNFVRFFQKAGRDMVSGQFFSVKHKLFAARFFFAGVFNADMQVFSPEFFFYFKVFPAFWDGGGERYAC